MAQNFACDPGGNQVGFWDADSGVTFRGIRGIYELGDILDIWIDDSSTPEGVINKVN